MSVTMGDAVLSVDVCRVLRGRCAAHQALVEALHDGRRELSRHDGVIEHASAHRRERIGCHDYNWRF